MTRRTNEGFAVSAKLARTEYLNRLYSLAERQKTVGTRRLEDELDKIADAMRDDAWRLGEWERRR